MNYKLIYEKLVEKAYNENIHEDVYYETHHIIPRCLGGNDLNDNLVKLTPEQHYVAHQLLVKIYPQNYKLLYACKMMCMQKIGNNLGNRNNNKMYGWLRKKCAEQMKIHHQNRFAITYGFTDYNNQTEIIWKNYIYDRMTVIDITKKYKMSENNVRQSLKFYANKFNLLDILNEIRHKNKSNISKNIRKNFTKEQECYRLSKCASVDWKDVHKKTGLRRIGKNNPNAKIVLWFGKEYTLQDFKKFCFENKLSKDYVEEMFSTNNENCVYPQYENKKYDIIICPHCKKESNTNKPSSFKRWHFENCKSKETINEN